MLRERKRLYSAYSTTLTLDDDVACITVECKSTGDDISVAERGR